MAGIQPAEAGAGMRNIRLIIEYDGTAYHGWQSQKNALAVQDVIEEAVFELTGEKSRIYASGRTDAGVHALGQVANFHTSSDIPSGRFACALNGLLPEDIVIRCSEEADMSFHSRYDSRGKKYRYIIFNEEHRPALMRNRAWHVPHSLDLPAMGKAVEYLQGTHDFGTFMSSGSSVENTVRTVTGTSIERRGGLVLFDIAADGFLYNMVRIIAGTLVETGTGRISADDMPCIIESSERARAGKTAPAHGLCLIEVYY